MFGVFFFYQNESIGVFVYTFGQYSNNDGTSHLIKLKLKGNESLQYIGPISVLIEGLWIKKN